MVFLICHRCHTKFHLDILLFDFSIGLYLFIYFEIFVVKHYISPSFVVGIDETDNNVENFYISNIQ